MYLACEVAVDPRPLLDRDGIRTVLVEPQIGSCAVSSHAGQLETRLWGSNRRRLFALNLAAAPVPSSALYTRRKTFARTGFANLCLGPQFPSKEIPT